MPKDNLTVAEVLARAAIITSTLEKEEPNADMLAASAAAGVEIAVEVALDVKRIANALERIAVAWEMSKDEV